MDRYALEREFDFNRVRRSKSFEVQKLLTGKQPAISDVKLPLAPVKRKRSFRRMSRHSMVNKDRESLASVSSGQSVDSDRSTASTLKRMKAAVIGKLRPSESLHSVHEQTPTVSAAGDSNGNSEQDKAKVRASKEKDRIERCQKGLELSVRYLREVVRTEKLEMLGGSTSAVLDIVLKLLVVLNEKGCLQAAGDTLQRPGKPSLSTACAKVYKKLNQLLQWSDKTLANFDKGQPFHKDLAMTELDCYGQELQRAINELLELVKRNENEESDEKRSSRDSGTGVSMEEDSANNNSHAIPPPKPPHPSQIRNDPPPPVPPRRRTSPPVSGDSGIFSDSSAIWNGENSPSTEHGPAASLFSQGSLDNILERLNLSDSFSLPNQCSTPSGNENDSGFEDQAQSSNTGDLVTTTKSESEEVVDGRKITISRVQVQRTKHSKMSTTRVVSGNSESDILKMLRESKDGELKITEKQHLKFATNLMTKSLDKLSPYDNNEEKKEILQLPAPPGVPQRLSVGSDYDNNFSTPGASSADNSPDHINEVVGRLVKTEKIMKESSSMQSIDRKSLLNGKLVENQSAKRLDNQKFKAAKSETFENGALVDRKGSGAYFETTHCRGDKEMLPPDSQAPPPLPPKRRHVAVYMDLVRPQSECPASEAPEESSARSATLASYVILRDKWRQHEEAYRQKSCSFQFSGGHTGKRTTFGGWQSPQKATNFLLNPDPDRDYKNLAEFVNWTENIQFPTKRQNGQKALHYQRRLALPCASVLGSVEAPESLVMRKTSTDSTEVWGGSTDGLIVYATQPGCHVLVYQEAFLTTYRTFVGPVDLIRRLVWRYQHFVGDRDKDQAKRKAARNTFSLIVRVVDDLSASDLKSDMLSEVNSFIYRLVEEGELNLARLLRQRLLERVEDKARSRNSISMPVHFLEVKSEHLAEQLTRADADLFQKIEEQSEEKSPNLVSFTEHFNNMSYWTRTRVLEPSEQKDRERLFIKFIRIMKHLRRLGNFNSYLAILSALESGPVRRLDWSRNVVESIGELSAIMDSSQSFKNYRTALAETKPPCLPYIGLILQDLTFVHVGNKNSISSDAAGGRSDILNFGKRWQQYTILDSVRRFKAWPFAIKKDDDVFGVFGNFESYLGEDAIWELSEKLKPRGGKRTVFV